MNGFQLLPKICVAFLPLSHQTSAHVLISTIWCGSLHSRHGTLRGDLCSAPVFVGCVSLWCLAEFSAPLHGEIDPLIGVIVQVVWRCKEYKPMLYKHNLVQGFYVHRLGPNLTCMGILRQHCNIYIYIMIYACISMAPYFTSCSVRKKRGMGSFLNTVWMSGINNLPTICICATATTLQRSDGISFKWIVTLMTA